MENQNPEQFQDINEKLQSQKINEKLNTSLENQAVRLGKAIDDATRGLISGIKTSNAKYIDELDVIKGNILDSVQKATSGGNLNMDIDKSISLSSLMGDMSKIDNLNMVLAFKFLKVKRNILKSVENATNGGNLDLEIDKNISLSDLLGESPNLNLVHAFRWLRIKKNILKKVETATESVELEIDKKMSLNDVLGSTPDQDILTKTRFFMIRQGLLKKISKAAKDFDPQESVDNITGGLGGGTPAVEGATAGATSSVIPPDALDAIKDTSQSLKTLVDGSKGDVLQDRENRKEDIAREKKRTAALSNLTGGKVAAGKEKPGGIGGKIAGVGKGVGEGISGFMKSLGKGLKALADKKYFISAGVLIALGGALFVTGKALKEFVGLDFKSIAIGVVTLGALAVMAKLIGKAAKEIFIGSLAIAALGASLIPAGFAFGMFSDINWAGVGIGIGVLVALGAAAFGLSFIAPAIIIGAAAIAVLGAAMIPAAFAFDIFGSALEKITPFFTVFADAISTVIGAVGDFLVKFVDSLSMLGDAGPGLLIAAAGIAAVSGALIAFSAAAAVGGIMSFFSGDPVKKFIELGEVAPDLATASDSIDKLSDSIQAFDTGEPDKLEEFVDQIKRLSKLKLKTVAKVMQHISEISGTASSASKVLPADTGIAQTANMTAAVPDTTAAATGAAPSNSPMAKGGAAPSSSPMAKLLTFTKDFTEEQQKKVVTGQAPAFWYLTDEQKSAVYATARNPASSSSRRMAERRFNLSASIKINDDLKKIKEKPVKAIPLDSPVAQSTSPQLEQKNTPRSVEIKDDGLATKEYIEAKLASDKAYDDLIAFEDDGSKKYSMVEEIDEFDDTVEVRKYDNAEDQAMFEKLETAAEDTEMRTEAEKNKIVGIKSRHSYDARDKVRAQFLDANVEKSKRKYSGDSSHTNSLNIDAILQESVERYKIKEMEASKSQSNSVEQIEKQSGNQLDMASRQNEADKNASKNGDGQTLNNVVNNKEGDTTQVTNTTINAQPHVDRTLDFLQPSPY